MATVPVRVVPVGANYDPITAQAVPIRGDNYDPVNTPPDLANILFSLAQSMASAQNDQPGPSGQQVEPTRRALSAMEQIAAPYTALPRSELIQRVSRLMADRYDPVNRQPNIDNELSYLGLTPQRTGTPSMMEAQRAIATGDMSSLPQPPAPSAVDPRGNVAVASPTPPAITRAPQPAAASPTVPQRAPVPPPQPRPAPDLTGGTVQNANFDPFSNSTAGSDADWIQRLMAPRKPVTLPGDATDQERSRNLAQLGLSIAAAGGTPGMSPLAAIATGAQSAMSAADARAAKKAQTSLDQQKLDMENTKLGFEGVKIVQEASRHLAELQQRAQDKQLDRDTRLQIAAEANRTHQLLIRAMQGSKDALNELHADANQNRANNDAADYRSSMTRAMDPMGVGLTPAQQMQIDSDAATQFPKSDFARTFNRRQSVNKATAGIAAINARTDLTPEAKQQAITDIQSALQRELGKNNG